MNCRKARRMVTPFINHELSDKETEQFLHHVEHCSDCMDELDTYFMVYRTIDTLDAGTHHKENDFQKMLDEEIRSAKRGILSRRILNIFRILVMAAAEVFMLLCIFIGYENRGEDAGKQAFHRALYGMKVGMKTKDALNAETETEKMIKAGMETEKALNVEMEVEKVLNAEMETE